MVNSGLKGLNPYYIHICNLVIFQLNTNFVLFRMANSLVFYGLSLNSSHLSGDPYTNFLLLAAVEIPALALCPPLLDRMGRKPLMVVAMTIGAAGCLMNALLPPSQGMVLPGNQDTFNSHFFLPLSASISAPL